MRHGDAVFNPTAHTRVKHGNRDVKSWSWPLAPPSRKASVSDQGPEDQRHRADDRTYDAYAAPACLHDSAPGLELARRSARAKRQGGRDGQERDGQENEPQASLCGVARPLDTIGD